MAIPKIVHFLWMSETKDERTKRCLENWREVLSGYEIKEWNSQSFPYRDFLWTKTAAEEKKWAFVTDYFRLWVLEKYGGIYLDADIILHKNFDAFLDEKLFIATEFTRQLGPHCIGAEPHHPFLRTCLDFYANRKFEKNILVPHIMTYMLVKQYKFNGTLANFGNEPLRIANEISIYPDNIFTIDISDNHNVAVHLGFGSWRDSNDINPIYTNVLEMFFIKRFYLHSIHEKKLFKRIIFLLLPSIFVRLFYKHQLKVKNLTSVKKYL